MRLGKSMFVLYLFCLPSASWASSRYSCTASEAAVQSVKVGTWVLRIEKVAESQAVKNEAQKYECKFSVVDAAGKIIYQTGGSAGSFVGAEASANVEVFGLGEADLNGDGIPDLVFRTYGGSGCAESFSIVLLGAKPVVLFDFDPAMDSALTVKYEEREKGQVLSFNACWFQYFEDRKLLNIELPVVRFKIEGNTWRNVSYDFQEAYQEVVKEYSQSLQKQGDESAFLKLSSTENLKVYPNTKSATEAAQWETLGRTREFVLGTTFEYLYGLGEDRAKRYLEEHWPSSESAAVWQEIAETYNKYPPRSMNFRRSREVSPTHNAGTPAAQATKSAHAEVRGSINCLAAGGCYIKPSAVDHLLDVVDAHPRMKCALRIRTALDSSSTNPVVLRWLANQRNAVRLATALWGDREDASRYIHEAKGSAFPSADSAADFLAKTHEQARALRQKLDGPEFAQILETCGQMPND